MMQFGQNHRLSQWVTRCWHEVLGNFWGKILVSGPTRVRRKLRQDLWKDVFPVCFTFFVQGRFVISPLHLLPSWGSTWCSFQTQSYLEKNQLCIESFKRILLVPDVTQQRKLTPSSDSDHIKWQYIVTFLTSDNRRSPWNADSDDKTKMRMGCWHAGWWHVR